MFGQKNPRLLAMARETEQLTQTLLALRAEYALVLDAHPRVEWARGGAIVHANERFLSLMECGLDDLTQRHLLEFSDARWVTDPRNARACEMLRQGGPINAVVALRTKHGHPLWLQLDSVELPQGNERQQRILCFAADLIALERTLADTGNQPKVRADIMNAPTSLPKPTRAVTS